MNNHLVSLEKLKKVAKEKGLLKYIKEIGYSNAKNKKYFVITIDNKKVNFGYDKMDDYLVHKNDDRRARFRARFDKIYQKYKNDYNKSIYWVMNLTW